MQINNKIKNNLEIHNFIIKKYYKLNQIKKIHFKLKIKHNINLYLKNKLINLLIKHIIYFLKLKQNKIFQKKEQ